MNRQAYYTFFFLLLLHTVHLCAFTQYTGGNYNGFSSTSALNINLSLADSVYNGGNGNGFSKDTALNVALNLTDSLYNGGNGIGFTKDTVLHVALYLTDSVYNGGNGNGFNTRILTDILLYITDSLYNGGSGKGEYLISSFNINLGICSDTLIWNGNTSIAWANPANWQCGNTPSVNSIVIIPFGVARYPTVFTNSEIKSLRLQNGASITVLPGVALKLNGQ